MCLGLAPRPLARTTFPDPLRYTSTVTRSPSRQVSSELTDSPSSYVSQGDVILQFSMATMTAFALKSVSDAMYSKAVPSPPAASALIRIPAVLASSAVAERLPFSKEFSSSSTSLLMYFSAPVGRAEIEAVIHTHPAARASTSRNPINTRIGVSIAFRRGFFGPNHVTSLIGTWRKSSGAGSRSGACLGGMGWPVERSMTRTPDNCVKGKVCNHRCPSQ